MFATRDTSLTQNTNIILSRYTRNCNLLLYNFVTRLCLYLSFSLPARYTWLYYYTFDLYIFYSPVTLCTPLNNCLFDFRFSSFYFLFSPLFFSVYYTTSLRYIYSDIYIPISRWLFDLESNAIETRQNEICCRRLYSTHKNGPSYDMLDSLSRCARVYVRVVVQLERR